MACCFNCGVELPVGRRPLVLEGGRLKVCARCEARAKKDIERLDAVLEGWYPRNYRKRKRNLRRCLDARLV